MSHSEELISFKPRGDAFGWLIALEALREVPFEIKRVYYIYATQAGVRRGKHAHRDLRQLAVCVSGSCRFEMDDGRRQWQCVMDRVDRGLLIEPMVWHEMVDFSPDCVLMVLASAPYDEGDYIRDPAVWRALLKT